MHEAIVSTYGSEPSKQFISSKLTATNENFAFRTVLIIYLANIFDYCKSKTSFALLSSLLVT